MPHFTLQIVPEGPVISLLVGASAPRVAALQEAGLHVPQAVVLHCLVDTGASSTCVDGAAIAPLGLAPTGATLISTPSTGGTPHQCVTYDVGMMFVHPAGNKIFWHCRSRSNRLFDAANRWLAGS